MSRDFTGSGDYMYASAAVTTYPFTMLCWFLGMNQTDGLDHILFGLWSSVTNWRGCYMEVDNRGANFWRLEHTATDANNWTQIRSNTLYDTAVWNCGICVATSNTDRRVMLNGAGFWQDTTNRDPTTFNKTVIGGYTDATNSYGTTPPQRLAHAAIWDIELSSTDLTNISAGRNPLAVQKAHLKSYWSLLNNTTPEADLSGNNNVMTVVGSPTYSTDNPTVDAPPLYIESPGVNLSMF